MTPRSYLYILTIIFLTSCDFKSADDYLKQGHDIGLTGNYKAAIPIFDKAIQKNPKLKEAYIQRGLCYENIHEDSLAINDYKKLLSFDHKNTTAFYYIGLCKYRQNKFEEAIEFYNNALITKGISNPLDTSRSQFVLDLNKNGILGEQATFDVASYEIYYERGLAYYSTGQIKRAFYDFENCINQKYQLGESNYMIGLCWLTANKKDKACEAFRQGAFYGDSLSKTQILEVCK
ncbi:tetratricopeptide repeat protein [Ferruginibacter sp. SUN002]|uniref:tetratricopeptide repeat protein n=1 Tax=Ferruginibacter sp. SUN002 TaxID=2937789 RepID=UPI003D362936